MQGSWQAAGVEGFVNFSPSEKFEGAQRCTHCHVGRSSGVYHWTAVLFLSLRYQSLCPAKFKALKVLWDG